MRSPSRSTKTNQTVSFRQVFQFGTASHVIDVPHFPLHIPSYYVTLGRLQGPRWDWHYRLPYRSFMTTLVTPLAPGSLEVEHEKKQQFRPL